MSDESKPPSRDESGGKTTVQELARIEGDSTTVDVRRIETPKGERLELESSATDTAVRLDAVALESLTWQPESTYESFLAGETAAVRSGEDGSVPAGEEAAPPADAPESGGSTGLEPGESTVLIPDDRETTTTDLTSITNEFGHVDVRKLTTADREGLELAAPKMDFAVRLRPLAVASVTWQPQDVFTELIRSHIE